MVQASPTFRVAVKDHIMVAHSLRGDVFGPAQRLHGATYVVTSEYSAASLDRDGIVLDIGLAHRVLAEVLAPLRFQNLDDLPQFAGVNTTTERLAQWIWQELAQRIRPHFQGSLRIQLDESHVAWASCEGPLG